MGYNRQVKLLIIYFNYLIFIFCWQVKKKDIDFSLFWRQKNKHDIVERNQLKLCCHGSKIQAGFRIVRLEFWFMALPKYVSKAEFPHVALWINSPFLESEVASILFIYSIFFIVCSFFFRILLLCRMHKIVWQKLVPVLLSPLAYFFDYVLDLCVNCA